AAKNLLLPFQGVLPKTCFCPFRACCQKLASVLSLQQMTVGAGQQPYRAFFIPGNEKKKPK
ncbi:MAG: hypothetical protein UE775_12345, partial [Segatella copri]|nr:hypothetical protein [Segatella copri]